MNFNELKNISWDRLSRNDLGTDFKNVFSQIQNILRNFGKLLISFEAIFPTLLPYDQNRITAISNNFSSLLKKIYDFTPGDSETKSQAIQNSKNLLKDISDFYSSSLPIISELQVYIRDEAIVNLHKEVNIQKNEIQVSLNNVREVLNNKIGEINKISSDQTTQIKNIIDESQANIQNKINEINQSNQTQQQLTQTFIENAQRSLDPKITELSQRLTQLDSTLEKTDELRKNVEKLNESTQSFSLTKIATEYGSIFKEEADSNYKKARLFGLFFLFGISISIATIYFWFIPLVSEFVEQIATASVIQQIEYYVLAFGVRLTILFLMCWVFKRTYAKL